MVKREHKQTQGSYIPVYIDGNGNYAKADKESLKWVKEDEFNLLQEGVQPKFNILESLKKIEFYINSNWGWFFKNGMK